MSCHLSLSFCISLFDSACLSALRFSEGLPFLLLGIFIYFLSWYSFIIQSVLLHLFICASAHICAHSSINPVVYLLYPSISPSISSISQRYIYIYLFIYPLKRTMCLAISPRVSLSLCLEMLKHTTFCGNQTQAQCSRHLFVPRALSQMSHEVNRMKRYH